MSKRPAFDPYALLEALDRERVSYLVVGGFARVVHGSAETTRGLDIVPSLRQENLRRLGRALDELDARGPDRRPVDAESLTAADGWRRVRGLASCASCRRRGEPAATTTCASAPSATTSAVAPAPPSPPSWTASACSKPATPTPTPNASYDSALSADGRFVAFGSWASNLVAGDTNGLQDIFVRDRGRGTTVRVSISSEGTQENLGSFGGPALTAHGRFVVFISHASNLVPGDTNRSLDVFVRDRVNGTTYRASVSSTGEQANSDSYGGDVSADGRLVGFTSDASNLVHGDTNRHADAFIRDRRPE